MGYGIAGLGFGIFGPSQKVTGSVSGRDGHTVLVFYPSTYTHLVHGRAVERETEVGSRPSSGGLAHP